MISKLLLFKETTKGVIPSNPKCFSIKAESFGIKVSQGSETNTLLGSGRGADRKTYGTDKVDGDLPIIWDTDNAPIWLHHGVGAPTAVTNATTQVWAASTVHATGDMINHTDGIHTLVVKTVGTTAGAIPTLGSLTRGNTVIDGSVVWIVMPLLKRYTGERADCLESFGIEVTDSNTCDGGTDSYTRFLGMFINSLPMSIAGGTLGIKSSLGMIGMTKEDSLLDASFVNLSVQAGFMETVLENEFYSLDNCVFELNGATSVTVSDFDVTTSNNVSMEDALNNKKIENIGQVTNDGNISLLFNTQVYKDAASHADQSAKLTFTKPNGCKMIISYPSFAMDKVDKLFETNKNTMLKIPLSAFDTTANKSITYEVISPLQSY